MSIDGDFIFKNKNNDPACVREVKDLLKVVKDLLKQEQVSQAGKQVSQAGEGASG